MKKFLLALLLLFCTSPLWSAEFFVGCSKADISPSQPCNLAGQMHARLAKSVKYPIMFNIVAMESREGNKTLDTAVVVGIDTVSVGIDYYAALRSMAQKAVPEINPDKIIFCATHTHSAPSARTEGYPLPPEAMKPNDFIKFASDKFGLALKEAWSKRERARYSYGLGDAVIAYNRRAIYADGHGVMYGNTNQPDFRAIEGVEDHDINCIFFWNMKDKPLGMLVNVSCPSQEEESNHEVSSDYWGVVRNLLAKKFGKDTVIVGLCGAAGDLSPHIRYRNALEARMYQLRNLSRIEEIGRKISRTVNEVYDTVEKDKIDNPVLLNERLSLALPARKVTKEEYENCKAEYEKRKSNPHDGWGNWNRKIIYRYERLAKDPNPTANAAVNVIRIGDCVICTNQYELYLDFGIMIKARSQAVMTMIVQLCNVSENKPVPNSSADEIGYKKQCCGGSYLPSARAKAAGGYGAVIQSNVIGPEGGQVLVEETLKTANKMFEKK